MTLASLLPVPAVPTSARPGDELLPTGLHFYTGDLHGHTGFSDGEGSPAQAFAVGRANGLDFLEITEHSESLSVPLNDVACLAGSSPLACPVGTSLPAMKWDVLQQAADQATVPGSFVALRGFEQTMDIQGHLTVRGSAGYIDRFQTTDVVMAPFWAWFEGDLPNVVLPDGHSSSGLDGIGAFAHPNTDKNHIPGEDSWRWDDFAFRSAADARMAMIEVENDKGDHSMWYAPALDKGWHLAPTAVSDSHEPDFGQARYGRTIVVAADLTPDGIRSAILARHVAATADTPLRIVLSSEAHLMGDRWSAPAGGDLQLTVQWAGASNTVQRIDIVSNGGAVVASTTSPAGSSWSVSVPGPSSGEHYYFARLLESGGAKAFTAPVWVTAT